MFFSMFRGLGEKGGKFFRFFVERITVVYEKLDHNQLPSNRNS